VSIESQTNETGMLCYFLRGLELSRVRSMESLILLQYCIDVDKDIMTEHIKIPVFEDLLGHKIIR
jgi:hypothetical protein